LDTTGFPQYRPRRCRRREARRRARKARHGGHSRKFGRDARGPGADGRRPTRLKRFTTTFTTYSDSWPRYPILRQLPQKGPDTCLHNDSSLLLQKRRLGITE
jgi:hypothetical protein